MEIRTVNLTCSNNVGQNTLTALGGFKIFQGESAKLQITPPEGRNLEGATKIRLIIKNYLGLGKVGKITMTAKEINYSINDIQFELAPSNTSAPGGLYLASVKFLDANEKIINASSGLMELVETDNADIFVPDADFTTEIEDTISNFYLEVNNRVENINSAKESAIQQIAEAKTNAENSIDAKVVEATNTANQKLGEIEDASGGALNSIDVAKTDATTVISTAKTEAVGSVSIARENALNEISNVKGEVQQAGANAQTELAEQLADSKEELANWSDQTAHLATVDANISALQLDKVNSGYLEVKGSYNYFGGSANFPAEVTCAFNLNMTPNEADRLAQFEVLIGNSPYSSSNGFRLVTTSNVTYITLEYVCVVNGELLRYEVFKDALASAKAKYLDGKWHSWVWCAKIIGNDVRFNVYLDGALFATKTFTKQFDTLKFSYSFYTHNSTTERLRNLRIFNFDISDVNAPYTVQDYVQNKPLPPSLLDARIYNTDPNMGASTAAGWKNTNNILGDWLCYKDTFGAKYFYNADLSEDTEATELGIDYAIDYSTNGGIRSGNIADYGVGSQLQNTKVSLADYAGKKVKIYVSFFAKKISDDDYPIFISTGRPEGQGTIIKSWDRSNFNFDTWTKIEEVIEFTVPSTVSTKFLIVIQCKGDSATSGSYRIAKFNLEILNNAILALENYTFNGEVLDVSANQNHATVSGNVVGTNDRSVETLFQKIASRISNQTIES